MTWINSKAYADKFINLLSDNRVMLSEWKGIIPFHIVQQPHTVVMNAKYLADGINEAIELYHPGVDFYNPLYEQQTLW